MVRNRGSRALQSSRHNLRTWLVVLPLLALGGVLLAVGPAAGPASAVGQMDAHVCRDVGNSGGVHAIFCSDLMWDTVTGAYFLQTEAICQGAAGDVACPRVDVFGATAHESVIDGAVEYTVWHKACGTSGNPACSGSRSMFSHDSWLQPACSVYATQIWGVTFGESAYNSTITLPDGVKKTIGSNLGTPHLTVPGRCS